MFTLDNEQVIEILDWKEVHNCTVTNEGAIGGKYTYEFTPTGLGMTQSCRCACGESINVTRFEDW